MRNVTSKLPDRHHVEVKARWWKTFDEASSPGEARRGLEAIIADYRAAYPSAMGVIERDLDTLVVLLRWPSEHRKRVRPTNLLERTFVEVRRRTKVIGRFPGETSALSRASGVAVQGAYTRSRQGSRLVPRVNRPLTRVAQQDDLGAHIRIGRSSTPELGLYHASLPHVRLVLSPSCG